MLLQLVQRATNLTTNRAGGASFHRDQHRGSAAVRDPAKRARDCEVRDAGIASKLAQFRDRVGGRERGIEACLDQFAVVRIYFG